MLQKCIGHTGNTEQLFLCQPCENCVLIRIEALLTRFLQLASFLQPLPQQLRSPLILRFHDYIQQLFIGIQTLFIAILQIRKGISQIICRLQYKAQRIPAARCTGILFDFQKLIRFTLIVTDLFSEQTAL